MDITISMENLQNLLDQQKAVTAAYITRNLTVYKWFNDHPEVDIELAKGQLSDQVAGSGYPSDFNVLKKYLK